MRKKQFLIAFTLMAGCAGLDTKASENAVGDFHRQLDAGNFDTIWQRSTDELKKSATEADFAKLLAAVHHKLGGIKTTTKTNWRVNATTSGSFTMLTYSTNFDRGTAVETFSYRDIGGKPTLNGYNINSTALIVN